MKIKKHWISFVYFPRLIWFCNALTNVHSILDFHLSYGINLWFNTSNSVIQFRSHQLENLVLICHGKSRAKENLYKYLTGYGCLVVRHMDKSNKCDRSVQSALGTWGLFRLDTFWCFPGACEKIRWIGSICLDQNTGYQHLFSIFTCSSSVSHKNHQVSLTHLCSHMLLLGWWCWDAGLVYTAPPAPLRSLGGHSLRQTLQEDRHTQHPSTKCKQSSFCSHLWNEIFTPVRKRTALGFCCISELVCQFVCVVYYNA